MANPTTEYGSYPRALGDSPPTSPIEVKEQKRKGSDNSLISSIDQSTEIVDPNRGTVKVDLGCTDPSSDTVVFPFGATTVTAGAYPGEDYAAHGFIYKNGSWRFPDSALPTRLEPASPRRPRSPVPRLKTKPVDSVPQSKTEGGSSVSKFFNRIFNRS